MTCSLQIEVSIIQEKLLNEFLPDDVCPFGVQLFMNTPKQTDQIDSKDNSPMEVNAFHYFLSFINTWDMHSQKERESESSWYLCHLIFVFAGHSIFYIRWCFSRFIGRSNHSDHGNCLPRRWPIERQSTSRISMLPIPFSLVKCVLLLEVWWRLLLVL